MTLTITACRNPVWNEAGSANTRPIKCEVQTSIDGDKWLPFNAMPTDPEQYGKDLHAALVRGDYGTIAAYVPPPDPPAEETE